MSERERRKARKEQLEQQKELSASQEASKITAQASAQRVAETTQNPDFLDSLRKPDVDSGVFDWLEDELGPALSGAHAVANHRHGWAHKREWLNINAAERVVTEFSPGPLLREDPELLAIAQNRRHPENRDGYDPEAVVTMTESHERRGVRDAYEVRTALQSLAEDSEGLSAVSEATAVQKVEKQQEDEASGATGRLKQLYK